MIEIVTNIIDKWINIVEKYKLSTIFKTLIIAIIAVLLFTWFPKYIENITEKAVIEANIETEIKHKQDHDIGIQERISIQSEIENILERACMELNCNRIWIVEMHNGTNNNIGLPFYYGAMTYEISFTNDYVGEDYQQIILSRYTFPSYLKEHTLWFGSAEDFYKIDQRLGKRIIAHDVKYIGICYISSYGTDIGYVGVSYTDKTPVDSNIIQRKLISLSQTFSSMLIKK